jgi:hypothetical protein
MGEKAGSRFLDFIVVLICLSGVAASLYFFREDLLMTQHSLTNKQIGTVTVKKNQIKRRISDRGVYDRLVTESVVYEGDLIHVASLSAATLNVNDNKIDLEENTMILLNSERLDFLFGNLNIASGKNSGRFTVNTANGTIEIMPDTVFNAVSGDNGTFMQVSEGEIQFSQNGQTRNLGTGGVIFQDAAGNEQTQPSVLVTQPRPNARILKTDSHPMNINFAWKTVNLESDSSIRLEISEDRSFSKIASVTETQRLNASASLNEGLWHWRFLHKDNVLSAGRLTITEAVSPVLIYPLNNSHFRYRTTAPEIQFQWSKNEAASHYILQVSKSPEFFNLQINMSVQGSTFFTSDLGEGIWYWRVLSVFPAGFEGAPGFSGSFSFQIERTTAMDQLVLANPAADSFINTVDGRSEFSFSWGNSKEAESYTIQISTDPNLRNPLIRQTTKNNYFTYRNDENILKPGQYYWSVYYTDTDGNLSPLPPVRQFLISGEELVQRLVYPPDSYSVEEGGLEGVRFMWKSNLPFETRFQVSSLQDFSKLQIDEPASGEFKTGVSVPSGEWYWRITAKAENQDASYSTIPRRFSLRQPHTGIAAEEVKTMETEAPAVIAETVPDASAETPQKPVPVEPPPPLRLTLISPVSGEVLPGLTALRQPTQFRWDTAETVARSRFVLSRQPNPVRGRPEVEIPNPERTVTVNKLGEGLWYWTVEAQTRDGRQITSQEVGQLRVQAIPLLPAPGNRLPARNFRITAEYLRSQRSVNFNWSEVKGANSYILSIYRQTSSGRQRILQTEPLRGLSYELSELSLLGSNGTYIWQVEAVFYNSSGIIEQRGRTEDNSLEMDIPRPKQIRTGEPDILYGL